MHAAKRGRTEWRTLRRGACTDSIHIQRQVRKSGAKRREPLGVRQLKSPTSARLLSTTSICWVSPLPEIVRLTPEQAKQQRDAALTKARQEGREAGRKEWGSYITDAIKAGVQAAVEPLKAAHQEITSHARSSAWWRGAAIGLLIGASAGALLTNVVLGAAFQQAGQYGREMVVTGAISQATHPPVPCVPGQRLDDGRVCPGR